MKYISLTWPLVLLTTGILYLLILFTLPFNLIYATLFLFALIGYWSRLPGVGIQHPFFILYQMDVIDIFSIIIAVNLGPFPAIIFLWFCNISSRIAGITPDWPGVIQDSILMSIAMLVMPLLNMITGGNLILLVTIYSIYRPIGFTLFNFIWPRMSMPERIITSIIAGAEIFIINAFYASLFGDFFDNLLGKGVSFNWVLFLFATIVILIVYIMLYGIDSLTPGKKTTKKALKKTVKIIGNNKKKDNSEFDQAEANEINFTREAIK